MYVFEQKCEKYLTFLSENFQFLEVKFSIYLNRRVFVMIFSLSKPCRCSCILALVMQHDKKVITQMGNEAKINFRQFGAL